MFRRCVAFIDDDQNLLNFFNDFLQPKGMEVHCFATHKEALEQICDIYPGIIFIDYLMEEGSGVQLLKQIKKRLPYSIAIMLTGEGNERVAVEAMKAGADDYLIKPVTPVQLMQVIEIYYKKFFSLILDLNGKYEYPLFDTAIARYEFLRAAYGGLVKNIKTICKFFTYSRQDFYNYERIYKIYGPVGLLKKKDFEKLGNPEQFLRNTKKIASLSDFIRNNDELQMKLEMFREAATTRRPNICRISKKYGFTRETFYQIYRRFKQEGLWALLEKRKGRPPKARQKKAQPAKEAEL